MNRGNALLVKRFRMILSAHQKSLADNQQTVMKGKSFH